VRDWLATSRWPPEGFGIEGTITGMWVNQSINGNERVSAQKGSKDELYHSQKSNDGQQWKEVKARKKFPNSLDTAPSRASIPIIEQPISLILSCSYSSSSVLQNERNAGVRS